MKKKNVLAKEYRGDDKLLLGMVLAIITFWLFAQTTLNIETLFVRIWALMLMLVILL